MIVGTVARLIGWKGHRFAVEALARLERPESPLYWLFVGDGPERQALEQLARSNQVYDRILFLGHRTDVPHLMAAMDFLVHPTTGEGFGLILLESMVQETPIVATRTGAIPEIVMDGRTGVLVNPGDPVSLADAIKTLMHHPTLRREYGLEGRRRYEECFTVDLMVENTRRVYRSLGITRGLTASNRSEWAA